jgi:hypothetical protein
MSQPHGARLNLELQEMMAATRTLGQHLALTNMAQTNVDKRL